MVNRPKIVLVHGALTDASVWNPVSSRLRLMGYVTVSPAMPLRGLHSDAAYLRAFLDTLDGPLVLVGHSYGGSVISHPEIKGSSVKALVFVSAFMLDEGESTGEMNGRWPGSTLGEATTIVRQSSIGLELYLKEEEFASVYAADVDFEIVKSMASAQRPIAVAALGDVFNGEPTWRVIPSWVLVSEEDRSLPAKTQVFMAERAHSTVRKVSASHAAPVSRPDDVADLIAEAVRRQVE